MDVNPLSMLGRLFRALAIAAVGVAFLLALAGGIVCVGGLVVAGLSLVSQGWQAAVVIGVIGLVTGWAMVLAGALLFWLITGENVLRSESMPSAFRLN